MIEDTSELEIKTIPFLQQKRDCTYQTLQMRREQANVIAEASDIWVQEQTSLSHRISALQNTLNPQKKSNRHD